MRHRNSSSGGGISKTTNPSAQPDVVIDPRDRPIVVWRESNLPSEILIRRFDDVVWRDVGTTAFDVAGRVVTAAGALAGSAKIEISTAAGNQQYPAVASSATRASSSRSRGLWASAS